VTEARVIGAGLSGLTTAWYLAEAGVRVCVSDAGSRPGGLIGTTRTAQGLVESAARGFIWSERVGALFAAVGLDPCFAEETSKRRYVFRDGRARRWPLTVPESVGAAARFGGAWVARATKPRADESVEAWGHRVLGQSMTRWLLAPALQGIYATPPGMLSAAAIFGGARKRGKLAAPAAGMGALMERLHERLIDRGVTFEFGQAVDRIDPAVPTAICTNAPAAARLLGGHAPRLSAAIGAIRSVSILPVTAFFEPRSDDLRGFGVLFPRGTTDALGVLFNADIFAGRSALRSETWFYGDVAAEVLPHGEAAIRERVLADRNRLTGRSDSPIAVYPLAHPAELPVYDASVVTVRGLRSELPPKLALAGNYLGRLGVSALVEEGAEAARRLAGRVQS
jgi:oxygen-dependent protoporphyrinogen oxidase